mmetsp:Transcript_24468/g.54958  ORF Transcript_24468/g.54958 Transcript_24468/m.54958 type:complete len:103 (+) Transcript_24468:3-311(+)
MKRMLCSVGQKESRRTAGANLILGFGSLGLLGLYGFLAYPIEREIVQLQYGTSGMKTRAARRMFALLRDGTLDGKAQAALVLFEVSRNDNVQEVKIVEAGGI